jgi:hypothetical protein
MLALENDAALIAAIDELKHELKVQTPNAGWSSLRMAFNDKLNELISKFGLGSDSHKYAVPNDKAQLRSEAE